jgi:hypothetical protein
MIEIKNIYNKLLSDLQPSFDNVVTRVKGGRDAVRKSGSRVGQFFKNIYDKVFGFINATSRIKKAYITMGVLEATENSTESAERTLEYVPTNLEVTLDILKSSGIKTEDIYTRELNMPFDMFNNMRSQTISNVVEFKTNNIDNLDLLIEHLDRNIR